MSAYAIGAGGYIARCTHQNDARGQFFYGRLAQMQRHMNWLARGWTA